MKKGILMSIVGLLVLSTVVTPVMAKTAATKEPFSATAIVTTVVEPGKLWITKDGMYHLRNEKQAGTISGYFDGTIKVVVNVNLNLTSAEGTAHGKFVITTNDGSIGGTVRVEGIWGMPVSGTFVGTHSTGSYEGKKIMGSWESTVQYVWTFDGIIISPQP